MITRLQFKQGLSKLNVKVPSSALDTIYAHFDVNGDRRMSYREFIRFATATPTPVSKLLVQLRNRISQISPKDAFNGLDENGDGILTPMEFKKGLIKMGILGVDDDKVRAITRAFGADEAKGNIQLSK